MRVRRVADVVMLFMLSSLMLGINCGIVSYQEGVIDFLDSHDEVSKLYRKVTFA